MGINFAKIFWRAAPWAAIVVLLAVGPVAHVCGAEKVERLAEKDLSGWVIEGTREFKQGDQTRPNWSLEDGVIRCAGKGFGFLRLDQKLGDFQLALEYRLQRRGNSGVGIRSVAFTGPARTRPSFAGYELQILDDHGKPPSDHSTMSLYRYVAPKANHSKPAGEWNAVVIECRGPKIRITHNGELVQDVDQSTKAEIRDKPVAGYVSLQCHGSPVEFRKLELTRFDKPEAKAEGQ